MPSGHGSLLGKAWDPEIAAPAKSPLTRWPITTLASRRVPKKSKKPNRVFNPHPARKPVAVEGRDYNQAPPRWQFSKIDWGGPYGWSAVDPNTLQVIAKKLAMFETMTWAELQKPGMHTTA